MEAAKRRLLWHVSCCLISIFRTLNIARKLMSKGTNDKSPVQSRDSRAEIAAAEIIETQEEAAAFIGRNSRTIRRWQKEGMLVAYNKEGKPVYLRSQLKLFAANEGKKPTQTKLKKDEAEAGIKTTRDERERWEFERDKGGYIRKDDVERNNIQKILTVKRALLGQGRKLAMQLAALTDPRKIQVLLDKENRQIIEGFAR